MNVIFVLRSMSSQMCLWFSMSKRRVFCNVMDVYKDVLCYECLKQQTRKSKLKATREIMSGVYK